MDTMRQVKERHAVGRQRQGGFTLIELMITVAIVGIIAAIAYPAYRRSVLRGRRTDATVSLTKIAQRLERCHTQFGTYDNSGCTVKSSPPTIVSDEGYYNITVTTQTNTFTLTANSTSKGEQTDDACNKFTVDDQGVKGVTYAGGGSNQVAECW